VEDCALYASPRASFVSRAYLFTIGVSLRWGNHGGLPVRGHEGETPSPREKCEQILQGCALHASPHSECAGGKQCLSQSIQDGCWSLAGDQADAAHERTPIDV
jgi:hypothetical protein